ncbi:unnamed protein product [Tuber melanosporum]|uniref:(Perigord truffle) hypothetical protein n=1 Tax=Tuber melanosporum (strain Mel28) TaxID=656061 RepID=D5G4J0_TUBMM|nr:uncharacterized protein GSTUM_00004170001 [Tuber melanosporum]CAZ79433.1 unnamed protein product [Tuber melanosporum]
MKTLKYPLLLLLHPFAILAQGAGVPAPVCKDVDPGVTDYKLSLSPPTPAAPERGGVGEMRANRTTAADGEGMFRRVVGGIAVAVLVAVV